MLASAAAHGNTMSRERRFVRAIVLATAVLTLGCGPEVDDEDGGGPPPPGELVYEDSYSRLYRLERRVEVVYDYERGDGITRKCGVLTDRAQGELDSTLASLDPSVDYGEHPTDCMTYDALVYVDEFRHSPFECVFGCCHPELAWAVFVYSMVLNNFDGLEPVLDGEPYIAIEPDQPCP